MSGDQASLSPETLERAVRTVISEVLFVHEEDVEPEKSLVADLGAESIDFLDLVFRLEDVLGKEITAAYFDHWVQKRLDESGQREVTVALMNEFVLEESGLGAR
ncbi:MAG: hypothetical protein GWM92_21340 [Gemmatimonadetes bacterium]|nr:acyl carrier protein [Gemmatimonadota bacterium]NIR79224.1 acyl carrier protein [Gemmatimonadota bacterium]NIT90236.1 acyl carrier protein [Gemmatimonadota bacterium]NIU31740.1 acyl carrier protein [Gemmatimonadota bacterium]NIU36357.1 hypothetical protein [Gemmatimonadota bacterium]